MVFTTLGTEPGVQPAPYEHRPPLTPHGLLFILHKLKNMHKLIGKNTNNIQYDFLFCCLNDIELLNDIVLSAYKQCPFRL